MIPLAARPSRTSHALRSVLVLLSSLAALAGQQPTPAMLIGLTASSGTNPTQSLTRQRPCAAPTSCRITAAAPVTDWAGGAAYNPVRQSVWHTEGTVLDETAIEGCLPVCTVTAQLSLGAASVASGLALSESALELYQLETIAGSAAIHTFHLRTCPPVAIRSCRFALPTAVHMAAGLAWDKANDLLFVSTSVFGSVANPQNTVLVLRRGDPTCQSVACRLPANACGLLRLGAITGLAYDVCQQVLYATDGARTALYRFDAAACALAPLACCALNHPAGETWLGFDVEAPHPQPVGASCLTNACRPCNTMVLTTLGDPTLGNGSFQARVAGGQAGSVSILLMGLDGCQRPGVPILCGELHPAFGPVPPFVVGIAALAGLGCNGLATHPLGVPLDMSLCDAHACLQSLIVCPATTGFGLGLTNAIEIALE